MKKYNFISKELKDFKPEDYHYFGFWKNNLFGTYFWQDCFSSELTSKIGLRMNSMGTMDLAGGNFIVKKSIMNDVSIQIKRKIEDENDSFFDNILKISNEIFKEGLEVGEYLRDKEPDIESFEIFEIAAKNINFIWALSAAHLVRVAEECLMESVLKENFPAEHVLEIIPKIDTPLSNRNLELTKLKKKIGNRSLSEIENNPQLYDLLKKHIDKYAWVEISNFIGKPLTIERLYQEINSKSSIVNNDKYKPEKPFSKEMIFRLKCMQICGYCKQAGAEYFSILTEKVFPFLYKTANKIGLEYDEFIYLNVDEIKKALKKEISFLELKKKSKSRKDSRNWLFFSEDNGNVIFSEDKDIISKLRKLIIPKASLNEEIRGYIANKGKYSGKAKIILNSDDFHKMRAGDVLVTTMTTPDFIILMKESGAIVTDIGGMLSHASIISREINKPCIIGTKFATQILKDGDLVEVDADEGIVRIIERAKK